MFVALVMGAALYLWRTAESGAELLEDELRATVAAEQWLPPYPHTGQYGSDLPAPVAKVQVQDIVFYGNVASVQVETTYTEPDGQTSRSRQRNFYQPTETGWVHVPPNSAYLGSLQVHETEFFTFSYHSIDAAAVEGVAAELDTVYTGLRNDYRFAAYHRAYGRGAYHRFVEGRICSLPAQPSVHPLTIAGVTPNWIFGVRGSATLAPERTHLPGTSGRAGEKSIAV